MYKAMVSATISVSTLIDEIEAEDEDQAHDIASDRMDAILREINLNISIDDTNVEEVTDITEVEK